MVNVPPVDARPSPAKRRWREAMARLAAVPTPSAPSQLRPLRLRAHRRARIGIPVVTLALVGFCLYFALFAQGYEGPNKWGRHVVRTADEVRSVGWAGVEVLGILGLVWSTFAWRMGLELTPQGFAVRRWFGWKRLAWSEVGWHRVRLVGASACIRAYRHGRRWPVRVYFGFYNSDELGQVLGWFQAKVGPGKPSDAEAWAAKMVERAKARQQR